MEDRCQEQAQSCDHAQIDVDGLRIGAPVACTGDTCLGSPEAISFVQCVDIRRREVVLLRSDGSRTYGISAARVRRMVPPYDVDISVHILSSSGAVPLHDVLAAISSQSMPWDSLEVIVVDDSEPCALTGGALKGLDQVFLAKCVRFVYIEQHVSAGARRNLAVAISRGIAVMQWNVCDQYSPARIALQSAPILSGVADITILPARKESHEEQDDTNLDTYAGGCLRTLCFRRELWKASELTQRYAEASTREELFLYRNLEGLHNAKIQLLDPGFVDFTPGMWNVQNRDGISQLSSLLQPSGQKDPQLDAFSEKSTRLADLELVFMLSYFEHKAVRIPLCCFADFARSIRESSEGTKRRACIKSFVKHLRNGGLDQLEISSLAGLSWCCSTLQIAADNLVWAEISKRILDFHGSLRVDDLTLLIHAVGCASLREDHALVTRLLLCARDMLTQLVEQDIVIIATAMARLSVRNEALAAELAQLFPPDCYSQQDQLKLDCLIGHLQSDSFEDDSLKPELLSILLPSDEEAFSVLRRPSGLSENRAGGGVAFAKKQKKMNKKNVNRINNEEFDALLSEFQQQLTDVGVGKELVDDRQRDEMKECHEESTDFDGKVKAVSNKRKKEKKKSRKELDVDQDPGALTADNIFAIPHDCRWMSWRQARKAIRANSAVHTARSVVEAQRKRDEDRRIQEEEQAKQLKEHRELQRKIEEDQQRIQEALQRETEDKKIAAARLKDQERANRAAQFAEIRKQEQLAELLHGSEMDAQSCHVKNEIDVPDTKNSRRMLATRLKKKRFVAPAVSIHRDDSKWESNDTALASAQPLSEDGGPDKMESTIVEEAGVHTAYRSSEHEHERRRKGVELVKKRASEERMHKKSEEEAAKKVAKIALEERTRLESAKRKADEEVAKRAADVGASILWRAHRPDSAAKEEADSADPEVERWRVQRLIKALESARSSGYNSMLSMIIGCRDSLHHANKVLIESLSACDTLQLHAHKLQAQAIIGSAMQRLKMYKQTPKNGLAIFCGFVLTEDGKEKKITIDFEPFKPINANVYRNGKQFFTEDLQQLFDSEDKFGFIIIDGNGALFGTLQGSHREILNKFNVDLPKKHGRGGQSALRFARLRLEKRHCFARKVGELAKQLFITSEKVNVTGLFVAGCADLKLDLTRNDYFDSRLDAVLIKPLLDLSYGGEGGFYRAIDLASDYLRDVKLIQEKRLITKLLDEIAKDTGKYCVGINDTIEGLAMGAVSVLMLWESLELKRLHVRNPYTGEELLKYLTPDQEKHEIISQSLNGGTEMVTIESVPFVEWVVCNYRSINAKIEFVTNRSLEGHQFCKGFGGIGGLLRYRLDFTSLHGCGASNDENERTSQGESAEEKTSSDTDSDFI